MIKRSFRSKLLLFYILSVVFAMVAMIFASNYIYRPLLIFNTRDTMIGYSNFITHVYETGASNLKRDLDKFDSSHDFQSIIYTEDLQVILNSAEDIYPGSYKLDLLDDWMDIYHTEKKADGTYFGEIEENSDDLDRVVYIRKIDDNTYLCMSKVVKSIDQAVSIANNIVTIGALLLVIIVTVLWTLPILTAA